MIKSLKRYLSLSGLLCDTGWHSFKKIDKNLNHDFLECACGERKFKCGYWHLVDEPIRKIIHSWLNREITQEEAWKRILDWKKQKNGSVW